VPVLSVIKWLSQQIKSVVTVEFENRREGAKLGHFKYYTGVYKRGRFPARRHLATVQQSARLLDLGGLWPRVTCHSREGSPFELQLGSSAVNFSDDRPRRISSRFVAARARSGTLWEPDCVRHGLYTWRRSLGNLYTWRWSPGGPLHVANESAFHLLRVAVQGRP